MVINTATDSMTMGRGNKTKQNKTNKINTCGYHDTKCSAHQCKTMTHRQLYWELDLSSTQSLWLGLLYTPVGVRTRTERTVPSALG